MDAKYILRKGIPNLVTNFCPRKKLNIYFLLVSFEKKNWQYSSKFSLTVGPWKLSLQTQRTELRRKLLPRRILSIIRKLNYVD